MLKWKEEPALNGEHISGFLGDVQAFKILTLQSEGCENESFALYAELPSISNYHGLHYNKEFAKIKAEEVCKHWLVKAGISSPDFSVNNFSLEIQKGQDFALKLLKALDLPHECVWMLKISFSTSAPYVNIHYVEVDNGITPSHTLMMQLAPKEEVIIKTEERVLFMNLMEDFIKGIGFDFPNRHITEFELLFLPNEAVEVKTIAEFYPPDEETLDIAIQALSNFKAVKVGIGLSCSLR